MISVSGRWRLYDLPLSSRSRRSRGPWDIVGANDAFSLATLFPKILSSVGEVGDCITKTP